MQIRIGRLRDYLNMMLPAIPVKSTLPILTNVLVHNGKLIANDMDNRITVAIPEARDCYFLLPARAILELLEYTPGTDIITIDTSQKGKLKVSWESGGGTLIVTGNPDDFPNFCNTNPPAEETVDGESLVKALEQIEGYTDSSKTPTRAVLGTVCLRLGETTTVAASDGFKMGLTTLNKIHYPWTGQLNIRKDTIKLLKTVWKKQPAIPLMQNSLIAMLTSSRLIKLSVWEAAVRFEFDNISIEAVTENTKAPDHLALIPKTDSAVRIRFMASAAHLAVRRLAKVSKEGSSIMKMQWTGDQVINFSAENAELGSVTSSVRIMELTRSEGNTIDRISANCGFFLDYMANKEGSVTMVVTSRTSPLLLNYANYPMVLIMPMAVQWEDEEAVREEVKLNEEDLELDYSDNVEMVELLGSRDHALTVKELKGLIKTAEDNSQRYKELKDKGEMKAEEAQAQIDLWENRHTTLSVFLEDNVDSEEETAVEEKEAAAVVVESEPVKSAVVEERAADGGVVVAKVDVLTLESPEGGKKTRKKKTA